MTSSTALTSRLLILILPALLAGLVAACGSEAANSDTDADSCFSGTLCTNDRDCGQGEHCNTSMHPGMCMRLYCGRSGMSCHEDEVCAPPLVCGPYKVCELEGMTPPPDTGSVDVGLTPDPGDDDATDEDTLDDDASDSEEPEEVLPLRYVMVRDLNTQDLNQDGTAGADIYFVELVHNSAAIPATEMEGCGFGTLPNHAATDCRQALDRLPAACDKNNPDFVSLGGLGGYVIVSFGRDIESGDRVRVYECGTTAHSTAPQEYYSVHVGSSTDPADEGWLACQGGERVTDISSCTVPNRPTP